MNYNANVLGKCEVKYSHRATISISIFGFHQSCSSRQHHNISEVGARRRYEARESSLHILEASHQDSKQIHLTLEWKQMSKC